MDAVSILLEKELGLLIARNEAEALAIMAHPGAAGMLPSLNLNGDFSTSSSNIRQTFSNGLEVAQDGVRSDNLGAAIQLNWTVFDGLGMFYRFQGLKQQAGLSELRARMLAEQLTAQLLDVYFSAVSALQILKQDSLVLKYLKEQNVLTKERLNNGLATRQQWLQSQLDEGQQKVRLEQSLGNWEQAIAQLKGALDWPPNSVLLVWDSIPLTSPDNSALAFDSIYNNSSLAEAALMESLAQMELKIWKANRAPIVGLNTQYTLGRSENTGGFALFNQNRGASFGVQLNFPVFNGFQNNLQVQQAKIRLQNAGLLYQDRDLHLRMELYRLASQHRAAYQAALNASNNLILARENLDLAMEQFRNGNLNALELARARQSFQEVIRATSATRLQAKQLEIEWMQRQGRFLPNP